MGVNVMSTQIKSSKDFAALIDLVQNNPHDPYFKMKVMEVLPQIKAGAKNNPLALYHLAKIYSPQSSLYRKTIIEAAELGSTNALFDAYKLLSKSNQSNDQQQAKKYLAAIYQSKDSFIINCLNDYLRSDSLTNQITTKNENYSPRFFNTASESLEAMEFKQDYSPSEPSL